MNVLHKKFLILCASVGLCLLIPFSALALSETEYRELLKDSEFAAADKELKQAWDYAKNNLPTDEFNKLKESQREWVKNIRDESAKELIDFQGYSKVMAYIAVTNERIKAIREMSGQQTTTTTSAKAKIQTGIVKADKDYITVIAEGNAENKQKALEGAYIDAVRLAVGAIISAKTELNNDELSENIIMHSRGVIESFDILDEKAEGGLTKIYIQARVHREILQDETKRYIEAQTVKADTVKAVKAQLNDNARDFSKQEKEQTGSAMLKELLQKIFDNYGPENFYSATLNSNVRYDEKTKKSYILISEKFNLDVFWNDFIPKLHKVFEKVALKKKKHIYIEDVQNANIQLLRTGYIPGGGTYENPAYRHEYAKSNIEKLMKLSWGKIPYSWAISQGESGGNPFYPFRIFSSNSNLRGEPLRAIIPNDNVSFTVYDLPVKILGVGDTPGESTYEDPQGIVSLWLKFFSKMCAPTTYVITYLDEKGRTINAQAEKMGERNLIVYRSTYHHSPKNSFFIIPSVIAVAPGFSPSIVDLFTDSSEFDKKYGGEFEVKLTLTELQRLDSMKFEIIFEQ